MASISLLVALNTFLSRSSLGQLLTLIVIFNKLKRSLQKFQHTGFRTLGAKHGSEVNKAEAGNGMEIIGLEVTKNTNNKMCASHKCCELLGAAWQVSWKHPAAYSGDGV